MRLPRRLFNARFASRMSPLAYLIAACCVFLLLHVLTSCQQYIQRQWRLASDLRYIARLEPAAQLAWKLADMRVKELNCLKLISGDPSELTKGLSLPARRPLSDYQYYTRATCNDYLSRLVTGTLSEDESQFPLAFSIMVYKDFDQLFALLRAIYRPEHTYCLHVDSKASWWFRLAVESFARCVGNVIISNVSIDVQWHRFSVLEAELSCWKQLLGSGRAWRYLINLTGQEYPLRTMRELVGILKQLRGANNIENVGPITSYDPYQLPASLRMNGSDGSVAWHKGSVHVAVCRGFVGFVFGAVGSALQEDLRRQDSRMLQDPPTDEVLFATLNYNSGVLRVPGAPVDASLETDNVKLPYLPRYKNWITGLFGYPCLSGKIVRGICIWGLADLPGMNRRFELFANKFFADFQPAALRCLEERFWHNTLADYGLLGLNKTWVVDVNAYANYSFVSQHT